MAILEATSLQTLAVGLTVFLFIYWLFNRRPKRNLPPGPRPLPLIGNFLQMREVFPCRKFQEWSKRYGPVISVYMGPSLTVVVNDIDSAHEVLMKRGADFATRPKSPSIDALTNGRKNIAFGEYGPILRLQRKLSAKAMRHYMQGQELEKRTHSALSSAFELMDNESGPYNPNGYVNFIATNTLCSVCFGKSYSYSDPEFWRMSDLINKIFEETTASVFFWEDFIPGLKYFPTRKFRLYEHHIHELYGKIFAKKFEDHKATFDSGNIRDVIDFLIFEKMEAKRQEDDTILNELTDEYMIQTIADMIVAGVDRARIIEYFAVLHMAAYPEIQAKVQKELDSVLAPRELPCLSHRPLLPYTEAVLHESMRIVNAIPTGITHRTTCDTKIKDYDIPKGTDVTINYWALHHDPNKWENVDEFIPERFLDGNGKLAPKPENWLPFSAGRRGCLGESVAKPELLLIFAALMHRFTWRMADGVTPDLTPIETFAVCKPKEQQFVTKRRC